MKCDFVLTRKWRQSGEEDRQCDERTTFNWDLERVGGEWRTIAR